MRGMGQKMDLGAQTNPEHGDSFKSSRHERSSGDPSKSPEHSPTPNLPNSHGRLNGIILSIPSEFFPLEIPSVCKRANSSLVNLLPSLVM